MRTVHDMNPCCIRTTHLHLTYSGGVYPRSVSEGGSYWKGGSVETYLLFVDFLTIAAPPYISRLGISAVCSYPCDQENSCFRP